MDSEMSGSKGPTRHAESVRHVVKNVGEGYQEVSSGTAY